MDNKEKKNEQDMINTQVEPHNHRAIIGFDKNGVPKVLVPVSGHTHKHVDENGNEYEHSHEEVFTEDYMKAVAAYRKTFPTKQDVLDNVPDPAVKEMMLRMEQLGYDTAFDRFDKQQPQCSFGLSGTCCRICNMGPCRITQNTKSLQWQRHLASKQNTDRSKISRLTWQMHFLQIYREQSRMNTK